jgi:hypothetical protein
MNLKKRDFLNDSLVSCTRCNNNYKLSSRFKLLCTYHGEFFDNKKRRHPCCGGIKGSTGCLKRVHTDLEIDSQNKEKPIEIIEKPSKEYDFYFKEGKDTSENKKSKKENNETSDKLMGVKWLSLKHTDIKKGFYIKEYEYSEWIKIDPKDYFFRFDEGLPEEEKKGIEIIEDKTEIIDELIRKNPKVCFSYDELLQQESDDQRATSDERHD